jgi:hypothetical protein
MTMGTLKILHVVGARSNFMKLAPVMKAIARVGFAEQEVVHTGQHCDTSMSDVLFADLGIPRPDIHLVDSGLHGEQTEKVLVVKRFPRSAGVCSPEAGRLPDNDVSQGRIELERSSFPRPAPFTPSPSSSAALSAAYFSMTSSCPAQRRRPGKPEPAFVHPEQPLRCRVGTSARGVQADGHTAGQRKFPTAAPSSAEPVPKAETHPKNISGR